MLPNKELLRVDEVARYFSVTKNTIYRWIKRGILEAYNPGNTIRVKRESVEKFLITSKIK